MSDTAFINDDIYKASSLVCSVDHPLSLGYEVIIVSNWRGLRRKHRVSQEILTTHFGTHIGACGLCATWNSPFRLISIIIDGNEDGKPIRVDRFLELVAHEVSHVVDVLLGNAGITEVDTELRAYYVDWIVGKIVRMTKIKI